MPRDVVLCTIGSAGDVYPFAGLGVELASRGHRVTLVANGYFEDLARKLGFEFIALGTKEAYLEAQNDPMLWDPDHGFEAVARFGINPAIRPLYDILTGFDPARTTLVFSVLCFGARLAQEKRGFKGVSAYLQPSCLRSVYETPVYKSGAAVPAWFPKALRRALLWLVDRLVIDRIVGEPLNAVRRDLGLSPVARVFDRWLHSPDLILGLFDPFFAAVQPDWPEHIRLPGFVLFDDTSRPPLSEEVRAFCRSGEPPVVVTAGSANIQGREFFAAVAEGLARTGRRGIFVTRDAGQLPARLPEGSLHLEYAPFGELFALASAVAHHGGIGTTARCLAAGTPQLISPFAHDQPDNAARVARIGAGIDIAPKRLTGETAAHALSVLLTSPEIKMSCRRWAAKVDSSRAAATAARLIEEL